MARFNFFRQIAHKKREHNYQDRDYLLWNPSQDYARIERTDLEAIIFTRDYQKEFSDEEYMVFYDKKHITHEKAVSYVNKNKTHPYVWVIPKKMWLKMTKGETIC